MLTEGWALWPPQPLSLAVASAILNNFGGAEKGRRFAMQEFLRGGWAARWSGHKSRGGHGLHAGHFARAALDERGEAREDVTSSRRYHKIRRLAKPFDRRHSGQ